MRTNIDIDDEIPGEVMRRHRLATKTEAVDIALRRPADRGDVRPQRLAAQLPALPTDTPGGSVAADPRPLDAVAPGGCGQPAR